MRGRPTASPVRAPLRLAFGSALAFGSVQSGTVRAAPPATPPADDSQPVQPRRHDGAYVGSILYGGVGLARVDDLATEGPFSGLGGGIQFGQMVLPWLGLGLQLGGAFLVRSEAGARQRLGEGALLVDFTFVPIPRIGLSLRPSFGFGGGAIRQDGVSGRAGFGGAIFGTAARYTFFPRVKHYRPDRGGGFGVGPELGWIGATPAARGRPTAHVFYLGLATTFYFGS